MQFLQSNPRLASVVRFNLVTAGLLLPAIAWSVQTQSYNIPPGSLDTVLNQFALESGIDYSMDARLGREQQSLGLQGEYSTDDAFSVLLADVGLNANRQNDGSYLVSQQGEWELDTIQVGTSLDGGVNRDQRGEANVYDKDYVTEYRGKEDVERFKGADSADLFKGMANVHSGDARNGGGIDPNIRGIQGPGRVPVVIDGTEQAITVNNGYRGASNRSFLDPNLIGSVTVHKGAQINPDVNTSVGGAVEITTLSPHDIIREGENFGMELIVESSSNSTSPREPRLYTGQHISTIPEYANLDNPAIDLLYSDPALRVNPEKRQDDNPLNGEDTAYRLAISGMKDSAEWLLAYAYRNRGNYFSGSKDASFYQQPLEEGENLGGRQVSMDPTHIGLVYHPGYEVPNTSSEMESYLGKFAFHLNPYTKVDFGARYTKSVHGEIMASRAEARFVDGLSQWPLNETNLQAYNLKLNSNPTHPYLDFKSNVWLTLSDIRSNTGVGSPNALDPGTGLIKNTSRVENEETRYGFTLSNKMLVHNDVDLILSGNYQYHELAPKGDLSKVIEELKQVRAGERTEYNASANLEWRATDSWIFTAAVRYGEYEVKDHYVQNRIDAGDTASLKQYKRDGYQITYQTKVPITQDNLDEIEQKLRDEKNADIQWYQGEIAWLLPFDPAWAADLQAELDLLIANLEQDIQKEQQKLLDIGYLVKDNVSHWTHNGDNRYNAAENICIQMMSNPDYIAGSCKAQNLNTVETPQETNTRTTTTGRGWMPAVSATWLITDNSRTYLRYAESLRFPSLFESTTGFSAVPSYSAPLKPERSKLWEVGYIHYFDLLNVKLTYFDQTIEDVLDRNTSLSTTTFSNLENLSIKGLELQAGYDDDTYFSDLSFAYNFENEICDQNSAAHRFMNDLNSEERPNYQECRRGGFSRSSYLANKVASEMSGSLHVGRRFMNRKLITGLKTYYTSGSHDDDYTQIDDATTLDAYVAYAFNPRAEIELRGSNLTDIYYLEAGSVAGIPAPGRTISLKLTGRF